ncbi:hypothetical protein ACTQ49_06490 [Luteococcus sp. Sow4_B9]|uniref:hypothetical protein n=1 Tax=Luteococcus sp. Sow4_B9 TaxID=3438792 RepID=UPI003F9E1FE1
MTLRTLAHNEGMTLRILAMTATAGYLIARSARPAHAPDRPSSESNCPITDPQQSVRGTEPAETRRPSPAATHVAATTP